MEINSEEITEEAGAVPVVAREEKAPSRKNIRGAARKIAQKDMNSPVVVATLIEDIDRLSGENKELVQFRDRFHEIDKQAAVMASKIDEWRNGDVLYSLCLSIGSALLGLAASLENMQLLIGGLSLALIIVASGSRIYYRSGSEK